MSKLPIISGMDCIDALKKIGFDIERQRGSHIILIRETPKSTISVPIIKNLTEVL